jgi:hypothetical protein
MKKTGQEIFVYGISDFHGSENLDYSLTGLAL